MLPPRKSSTHPEMPRNVFDYVWIALLTCKKALSKCGPVWWHERVKLLERPFDVQIQMKTPPNVQQFWDEERWSFWKDVTASRACSIESAAPLHHYSHLCRWSLALQRASKHSSSEPCRNAIVISYMISCQSACWWVDAWQISQFSCYSCF